MAILASIMGRAINDSRGQPTIEVTLTDDKGQIGTASLPIGSSLGKYEIIQVPAAAAVTAINTVLAPALLRTGFESQSQLDAKLNSLNDETGEGKIGANALLGISLAFARLLAQSSGQPLYQYIQSLSGSGELHLLTPMFNLINGGKHATNNLDFQEYLVIPQGFPSFHEKLMAGKKIFQTLGQILHDSGHDITIGYEGGYAPNLTTNEEGLGFLVQAIEQSGFTPGKDVSLGVDIAAASLSPLFSATVDNYLSLVKNFPLMSIEDPFNEDAWDDWHGLKVGLEAESPKDQPYLLVGDDLYAGDKARLEQSIEKSVANAFLVKMTQSSTLTDMLAAIQLAKTNSITHIPSHRAGETLDTFVCDLAVGTGALFIKAGAPNEQAPERMIKYERLSEIEAELTMVQKPVAGQSNA